ncbi:helix-turn-helix transcriptional regulator [Geomicrobium sediminis]|uniref:Transcriptional regulator with XRE-family HTH domain n=1 Tax=Geomicrobium sediminis TaxID=1347788 RepID=A0ABS2PEK5_9BACL|nr:hypothetical protein DH09_08360 [Bacillaceae bacterium JMAK1]MBM7633859.1 transcriptional regulator with XRE-family HTH domain [Geomicrobium sediminis]
MIDRVSVGKRLKELRKRRRKNTTIKEVAKALGIHENLLSSYEKGERLPSPDRMIVIAEYYGQPVEAIFFAYRINKLIKEAE